MSRMRWKVMKAFGLPPTSPLIQKMNDFQWSYCFLNLAKDAEEDDTDPLLMEAIDTCVELGQASTSFIQRRFKVGYARAGRIIDQMEARGIISGYEGSKPRQVLITMERLNELKMAKPPAENTEG